MNGTGFSAVAGAANTIMTVRTAINRTEAVRMRMVSIRWLVMGDLLQVNRMQGP
jgi:hypothetical protein